MQPAPIGLIGLGLIGAGIAQRLLAARHTVLGFDPDPARTYLMGALAGKAAASAREVFGQCTRVLLSLPDSQAVQEMVYRNADAFQPGLLLIDTSPGDPEPTARLAREVLSRAARYVDVTILGSPDQIRAGEVTCLSGGDVASVTAARELVMAFARHVIHAGGHGAGARVKLAVTMVLGLHRAVLAEGLAFARGCGLDLGVVMQVLRGGAAHSRVMDTKGDKMLERDFTPQSRLAQHVKDVRLILAEATRSGMVLPLTVQHLELLERVAAMGCGDEDNCAIMRAYD